MIALLDRYDDPGHVLAAQEHITSMDWGWLREKEKTKSYEFYTYLTVEIALERACWLVNEIKMTYYAKFMLGGEGQSEDGGLVWLRSVLDDAQAMLDEMKWLWEFADDYSYPHPMVFNEAAAPEWRKRRCLDFFGRATKKNNALGYVRLMRAMLELMEADREDPWI